jgi:hypothetical protein
MIAVSLDNLLFFLLIAVAALFQLLSKAVSKAGKSDSNETSKLPKPQTPRPVQRAPRESDADRIRKFLEALGQPPGSTPPSPVLSRTDIPPRPLAPVKPPTVIPGTWQLPRQERQTPDVTPKESRSPEQQSHLRELVRPPVPIPATPGFEIHEALPVELQQPPSSIPAVKAVAGGIQLLDTPAGFTSEITTLLVSRTGLRQAIILREIFGPPRSLQTVDLL